MPARLRQPAVALAALVLAVSLVSSGLRTAPSGADVDADDRRTVRA